MSTPTTTSRRPAARGRRRPRMRPALRRGVLVLHLLSVGAWVGIDVMVGVLVVVGRFGDAESAALAYRALGSFVVVPMLMAALATLATGVLLALGTRWGLTRYWWVLGKLAITLALAVLILLALRPGMPEVVLHGEQLAAGIRPTGEVSDLVFPPAVSIVALSIATILSVYKPWGRVRD